MIVNIANLDKPTAKIEALKDGISLCLSSFLNSNNISHKKAEVTVDLAPQKQNAAISKKEEAGISKNEAEKLSFIASTPQKNANSLRLPKKTQSLIHTVLSRLAVKETVYDKWELSSIDPYPRLSLNFSGPPGTGKTLAAHHIAKKLNKKIIEASYADIVSKYFGEGAKNLVELFEYALKTDSILFIDESETLLSKRSSNHADGASHAINSMRSQLLILMEKTPILSIFSTNLINCYDPAFESRLINIAFELPDQSVREAIWSSHLPSKLPRSSDVSPKALSIKYNNINGREIARTVIEAAHKAAIAGKPIVEMDDIDWAMQFVRQIKVQNTLNES